jgi:drug/metabolite transporter (DMT)-like permease
LSISSAILQATPILVALGGILFLNQKVKLFQWVFIAIGFLGVFFILRPDSNEFNSLSLIAILGVFFLALRDVITHKISDTIPAVSISFWGFFSLTVGGIFCIPFFGSFIPFNYQSSALILFSAFIGPSAYLALVFATRSGDVATISPFRYTRLPFALTISFFLFDERLDSSMLIGCFFVVFSGFCILLFNTKKLY